MINSKLIHNINIALGTTPSFRDFFVDYEYNDETTLSITFNRGAFKHEHDICEILQMLTDEIVRINEDLKASNNDN